MRLRGRMYVRAGRVVMNIGDSAQTIRAFSQADVDAYVALGGAAPEDGVVPEPMIGALFSYLLGVRLPGPGTNYLKQSLRFEGDARIGDEMTARVEITRIRPEKALVDLATVCTSSAGETICTGRALVRVKDVG